MGETITTAEGFDALPIKTVIRCDDVEGIGMSIAERTPHGWQFVGGANLYKARSLVADAVPYTVLYRPDEQPTAQPTVAQVALAIHGRDWEDIGGATHQARAVLALLPGRPESVVKAEALREAAAGMGYSDDWDPGTYLLERADRIGAGQ